MTKSNHICSSCPAQYEPCLSKGSGDNPAHLIVIGESPSGFAIGSGQAFYGRDGRFFRKLLNSVLSRDKGKYANTKVYFTYATRAGAYKPTIAHINSCRPNLLRELGDIRSAVKGREPVILTLGPLALKAVGITAQKITEVVAHERVAVIPSPHGERRMTVIPNLSMTHLFTQPGVANVVMGTILKAVKIAHAEKTKDTEIEELSKDYRFPSTIEEVKNVVNDIIDYCRDDVDIGPEHWPISIDTETNTLYPYSHTNPQVLMLSVSWDEGKASTILLDHEKTPYDRESAWAYVRRLLACPKPKVFHNFKFDLKFIELLREIRVNRVVWDTMLGEHYIDEDKKGHYSLKQLTPIYAPAYTGYDEELQQVLRGTEEIDEEGRDKDGFLRMANTDVLIKSSHVPDGIEQTSWDSLVTAIKEQDAARAMSATQRKKSGVSLKDLTAKVRELRKDLKIKNPPKKKKNEDGSFAEVDLSTIVRYAGVDADVTRIILKTQTARLHKTGFWNDSRRVMRDLYLPASRVLGKMEYRGVKLNIPYLDELENDITARLSSLEKELHAFDSTLNVNAPHQVSELMQKMNFDTLPGVEIGSTAKEALEKYTAMYNDDDPRHTFVSILQEYREVHQAMKLYIKPLRKFSSRDGKIHCSFNLNGTSTGRLSSSGPNLQNIVYIAARKVKQTEDGPVVVHPGYNIKKLFIPHDPDNVFVNVDIKGAEIRVYTAYSRDELMIDALLSGMDVHSFVTSKVYGIPYEEVVAKKDHDPDIKEKRSRVKRVIFATLYGGGPFTIAAQINSTIQEAEETVNYIFNAFPAIKAYVDHTAMEVRTRQIVQTYFGRCRRFRLANLSHKQMGDAIREAVNFKIQSTSADLVLSQLCEMDDNFGEIGGRMLLTVHDSMGFEMPAENVEKLPEFLDTWIVDRVKEKYPWLPVPFLYDIEVGPSYGELREYRQEKVQEATA